VDAAAARERELMDPDNLIELAAYIERYAETIGVRVDIDGRLENLYLSELPPRLAIHEAFRLLFDGRVPHRGLTEDERGTSAILNAPKTRRG
jgi:hypothetical protein